jgi:hypothetical protein
MGGIGATSGAAVGAAIDGFPVLTATFVMLLLAVTSA